MVDETERVQRGPAFNPRQQLAFKQEKKAAAGWSSQGEQDVHFNRCYVSPRITSVGRFWRPSACEPGRATDRIIDPRTLRRRRSVRHQFSRRHAVAIDEINAKGGILPQDQYAAPRYAERRRNPRAQSKRCSTTTLTLFSVRYSPVRPGGLCAAHPAGRDSGDSRRRGRSNHPERATLNVFRTSFGSIQHAENRQLYSRSVKAKSVAVLWVNNDFGKGGAIRSSRKWPAVTSRSRPTFPPSPASRFLRRRGQDQAANADRDLRLCQRRRERAILLREAKKQGVKTALIGETTC